MTNFSIWRLCQSLLLGAIFHSVWGVFINACKVAVRFYLRWTYDSSFCECVCLHTAYMYSSEFCISAHKCSTALSIIGHYRSETRSIQTWSQRPEWKLGLKTTVINFLIIIEKARHKWIRCETLQFCNISLAVRVTALIEHRTFVRERASATNEDDEVY